MDEFRKIPPVTRFMVASLLCVTLPMLLNITSFYQLAFIKDHVFPKFEVCSISEREGANLTEGVALALAVILHLLYWMYALSLLELRHNDAHTGDTSLQRRG